MPWIGPIDRGSTFAFCRVCSSHISVSSGGCNDAVRHAGSAAHGKQQMAISAATQPCIRSFFVSSKATELSMKMMTVQVRFGQFLAEHNLSFSTAVHFTKLAKGLFPDSDITRKFESG